MDHNKPVMPMMQKCLRQIVIVIFFASFALTPAVCLAAACGDSHAIAVADEGKSICRIIAGPNDKIAAESLQRYLRTQFNVTMDIVEPGNADSGQQKCEILLGTQITNSYLSQMAKKHNVVIDPANLTTDGYVLYTIQDQDRDVVLAAGGGKRGVFYAVGELKKFYLRQTGDSVIVLPAKVTEVPTFKYRWLWAWDWRMEWSGILAPNKMEACGGGTYRKKTEAFLKDCKTCIDFMSENGLNGLIIWGFLRDTHGGVAASQEICDYAHERGVRILPGVGTSGYAGYYFEGDHPYNADTWLKKHPELRAVDKDGKFVDGVPCPSKKANQDWLDEGAKWLFENFRIGGVNLEMGDFFVCYCDNCKSARAAIDSDEPDYYKDMAISHQITFKTMRQLAPDAWLSYATYTDFSKEMMTNPPKFIEMIPSDAICQWTQTYMTPGLRWSEGLKPMAKHNIGYLHWASRWMNNENDFYLESSRKESALAHRAGMEGLDIYGEVPDSFPNMELNYLAFREYCFHPDMSQEAFTKKRIASLYGEELTDELWKIIDLVRSAEQRKSAENKAKALEIAQKALGLAPDHTQRRWQAMVTYLESLQ
jgi:hypothetical protein